MNSRTISMVPFLAIFLCTQATPETVQPSPTVVQTADRLVAEIKRAHPEADEYAKGRKYYAFPTRAKVDYYGIFFTLESFDGGNNVHYYFSALKARGPDSFAAYGPIDLGQNGIREINADKLEFERGRFVVHTLDYKKDDEGKLMDPVCCPSLQNKIYISVIDGSLHTSVRP